MPYPQKGATRHHRPKFVDRMMAGENAKPAPFRQPPVEAPLPQQPAQGPDVDGGMDED
jgi:hypothetical protein